MEMVENNIFELDKVKEKLMLIILSSNSNACIYESIKSLCTMNCFEWVEKIVSSQNIFYVDILRYQILPYMNENDQLIVLERYFKPETFNGDCKDKVLNFYITFNEISKNIFIKNLDQIANISIDQFDLALKLIPLYKKEIKNAMIKFILTSNEEDVTKWLTFLHDWSSDANGELLGFALLTLYFNEEILNFCINILANCEYSFLLLLLPRLNMILEERHISSSTAKMIQQFIFKIITLKGFKALDFDCEIVDSLGYYKSTAKSFDFNWYNQKCENYYSFDLVTSLCFHSDHQFSSSALNLLLKMADDCVAQQQLFLHLNLLYKSGKISISTFLDSLCGFQMDSMISARVINLFLCLINQSDKPKTSKMAFSFFTKFCVQNSRAFPYLRQILFEKINDCEWELSLATSISKMNADNYGTDCLIWISRYFKSQSKGINRQILFLILNSFMSLSSIADPRAREIGDSTNSFESLKQNCINEMTRVVNAYLLHGKGNVKLVEACLDSLIKLNHAVEIDDLSKFLSIGQGAVNYLTWLVNSEISTLGRSSIAGGSNLRLEALKFVDKISPLFKNSLTPPAIKSFKTFFDLLCLNNVDIKSLRLNYSVPLTLWDSIFFHLHFIEILKIYFNNNPNQVEHLLKESLDLVSNSPDSSIVSFSIILLTAIYYFIQSPELDELYKKFSLQFTTPEENYSEDVHLSKIVFLGLHFTNSFRLNLNSIIMNGFHSIIKHCDTNLQCITSIILGRMISSLLSTAKQEEINYLIENNKEIHFELVLCQVLILNPGLKSSVREKLKLEFEERKYRNLLSNILESKEIPLSDSFILNSLPPSIDPMDVYLNKSLSNSESIKNRRDSIVLLLWGISGFVSTLSFQTEIEPKNLFQKDSILFNLIESRNEIAFKVISNCQNLPRIDWSNILDISETSFLLAFKHCIKTTITGSDKVIQKHFSRSLFSFIISVLNSKQFIDLAVKNIPNLLMDAQGNFGESILLAFFENEFNVNEFLANTIAAKGKMSKSTSMAFCSIISKCHDKDTLILMGQVAKEKMDPEITQMLIEQFNSVDSLYFLRAFPHTFKEIFSSFILDPFVHLTVVKFFNQSESVSFFNNCMDSLLVSNASADQRQNAILKLFVALFYPDLINAPLSASLVMSLAIKMINSNEFKKLSILIN
ncbi:hypothetical protein ROZALSC1DRAFT_26791 [Rozella allomycis CSF55]|uniref:Uncharacterized protein n=1 Tax=Rozella allomycis (strain CSF55) TaxID=988480 RepID=A0A075AWL2_ROZAC|nr:hypothetical protein O9G_001803 [Rozella allomycis CSF55]RKP21824.1 hypothetical protein ROZALSC1DRAFT_26791 [Rozella allomycis CSF55]|eukprot:EPZ34547.1 hypothetical protein O9G_001803 [Rozella allomycis CSF55]